MRDAIIAWIALAAFVGFLIYGVVSPFLNKPTCSHGLQPFRIQSSGWICADLGERK